MDDSRCFSSGSVSPKLTAEDARPKMVDTRSEARVHMDKKAKKRLEILNQKLQIMRQQLAGCRQQNDEPADVRRLEAEVASVEAEIKKLKGA